MSEDRSTATEVTELLASALLCHRAGHLGEAEQRYRRVVQIDPSHADARHLLGVVAYQTGRLDVAVELMSRSIVQSSVAEIFHNNLGLPLIDLGKLEAAALAFRRALVLKPDYAEAQFNQGNVLKARGDLEAAAASYAKALAVEPDYAEARYSLAVTRHKQGALEQAAAAYGLALAVRPDYAEAHSNLGAIHQAQGASDLAQGCYERALTVKPDHVEALANLGTARLESGAPAAAALYYRRALAVKPNDPQVHSNLGCALRDQGELGAAAASGRRVLSLMPNHVEATLNLAGASQDQGRLDDAVALYDRVLRLEPGHSGAAMQRVFTQLYRCESGLDDILARARRCAALYGEGVPAVTHAPPRQAGGLPRIGFISTDFRSHAVGFLAIPAIEGLARSGFHLTCYAASVRYDEMTARFAKAATVWRQVAGWSDDALRALIRADGIDILIDLCGYAAGNRLPALAGKPAPIQVAAWVGYPATTGMPAMDYFLADHWQIPTGAEAYYSEKIVRLPANYIAFAPPDDAPPVSDLPARTNGFVTFGAFNVLKKTTPRTVAVWSRILRRLPAARLLMKSVFLQCPQTAQRYRDLFAAEGIVAERLTLMGGSTPTAHRAAMAKADLALDSFPYSGGMTTLESLWMGLPVVTLPGETFASRHSLGYLATTGLSEFVASGVDDYVDLAVGLANDLPRLAALRAGMRRRLLDSPLCDIDRYSADLAAALTGMWRRWCDGLPTGSFAVPAAAAAPQAEMRDGFTALRAKNS